MQTAVYLTNYLNSKSNTENNITQASFSQNYSPFSFGNFIRLSQNKQIQLHNLSESIQLSGFQTSSYETNKSFSQTKYLNQSFSPISKSSEVTVNSQLSFSLQPSMLIQQNVSKEVSFILPFYPAPISIQSCNDKLVKKEENTISFKKFIPQSQNTKHQLFRITPINKFKNLLQENQKTNPIHFKTTDELIRMKMWNKKSKSNQTKERIIQSESLLDARTKTPYNQSSRKQLVLNRHKKIEKKNIPRFHTKSEQITPNK